MNKIFLWELKRIFTDTGTIIFMLVVPLLYPLLYSWMYNNEVVHEVPVVVVDESRSSLSRELIRRVDASPNARIVAYEDNMESARRKIARQEAHGIIHIPSELSRDVSRGIQTTVGLYVDMSSMLYYKALLSTLSNVTLNMGVHMRLSRENHPTVHEEEISATPLACEEVPLFNSSAGYGSFLIPAVLILVLQQTLLLGIGLSAGTVRERNVTRSLVPPEELRYSCKQVLAGKALCYFVLYAVLSSYVTVAIPHIFHFIQMASLMQLVLILLPFILSCIFFGLVISCVVRYRENVLLLVVFTSVPMVFLSGVIWPASALSLPWKALSYLLPSTFGINAYVKVNSMGASIGDVLFEIRGLWIQTAFYFLLSLIIYRVERIRLITQQETRWAIRQWLLEIRLVIGFLLPFRFRK